MGWQKVLSKRNGKLTPSVIQQLLQASGNDRLIQSPLDLQQELKNPFSQIFKDVYLLCQIFLLREELEKIFSVEQFLKQLQKKINSEMAELLEREDREIAKLRAQLAEIENTATQQKLAEELKRQIEHRIKLEKAYQETVRVILELLASIEKKQAQVNQCDKKVKQLMGKRSDEGTEFIGNIVEKVVELAEERVEAIADPVKREEAREVLAEVREQYAEGKKRAEKLPEVIEEEGLEVPIEHMKQIKLVNDELRAEILLRDCVKVDLITQKEKDEQKLHLKDFVKSFDNEIKKEKAEREQIITSMKEDIEKLAVENENLIKIETEIQNLPHEKSELSKAQLPNVDISQVLEEIENKVQESMLIDMTDMEKNALLEFYEQLTALREDSSISATQILQKLTIFVQTKQSLEENQIPLPVMDKLYKEVLEKLTANQYQPTISR